MVVARAAFLIIIAVVVIRFVVTAYRESE